MRGSCPRMAWRLRGAWGTLIAGNDTLQALRRTSCNPCERHMLEAVCRGFLQRYCARTISARHGRHDFVIVVECACCSNVLASFAAVNMGFLCVRRRTRRPHERYLTRGHGRISVSIPDSPNCSRPGSDWFAAVLRYDLPASLVVFLVALPLSLGIAIAWLRRLAGLDRGDRGRPAGRRPGWFPVAGERPAAGLTVIVAGLIAELMGRHLCDHGLRGAVADRVRTQ